MDNYYNARWRYGYGVLLAVLVLFFVPHNAFSQEKLVQIPEKTNVAIDKTWTITLNGRIDPHTVTSDAIFVMDSKGERVETQLVYVENEAIIEVYPPQGDYKPNSRYTLYATDMLKSNRGKNLKMTSFTFTTGSHKTKQNTFIENERNTVDFANNVTVLTELEGELVDYSNDQLSILRPSTELQQAERGEIIILPATEQYPRGFAVRVLKSEMDNKRLELDVEEPTLEELLVELDVANSFTFGDFENVDEINAQSGPVASTYNAPKKNFELELVDTDFDGEKDGLQLKMEKYPLGDHIFSTGNITFAGDFNITEKKNTKQFSTSFKLSTNANFAIDYKGNKPYYKKFELIKKPLRLTIPQTLNTVGVSFTPSFVIDLDGHVGKQLSLKSSHEVAFTVNGHKDGSFSTDGVKLPQKEFVTGMSALNAKLQGKASFEILFTLDIVQYEISSIGAGVGLQAELEGYLDGLMEMKDTKNVLPTVSGDTNYCLSSKLDFFVEPFILMGDSKKPDNKTVFFAYKNTVHELAYCKIQNLLVDDKYEMNMYTDFDFAIKGMDSKTIKHSFDIGDERISFANNAYIHKVHKTPGLFDLLLNNRDFTYQLRDAKIGEEIKATMYFNNILAAKPVAKEVVFTARGNIRGKVLDDRQRVINGAKVSLYKMVNFREVLVEQQTVTKTGAYEFVAPKEDLTTVYVVKVTHPDYEQETMQYFTFKDWPKETNVILKKQPVAKYSLEKYGNYKYVKLHSTAPAFTALNKMLKQPAITAKEDEKWLYVANGKNFISVADTEVKYDKQHLLSVTIETYNDYLSPRLSAVTMNLKTGKRLMVTDVFPKESQQQQVYEFVKQQLRMLGEPRTNPVYREDRLKFDPNWGVYIQGDKYVIVINHEYTISDANIFDIYEIPVPTELGLPLEEL